VGKQFSLFEVHPIVTAEGDAGTEEQQLPEVVKRASGRLVIAGV
jgi:hypothetical protein